MKYRLLLLLLFSVFQVQAEEPALPEGLEDEVEEIQGEDKEDINQPSLPEGLEDSSISIESNEPGLPAGLDELSEETLDTPELPEGLEDNNSIDEEDSFVGSGDKFSGLSGFWEARLGLRTQDDQFEDDRSMTETRLQLDLEQSISSVNLHLVTDLIYDDLADSHNIDLETGQGWIDLREANLSFTPTDFMDVKFGRQILTWGTGDLLFINDLFPKDWQAFFIGRDVEYLKAPSDAIKLAFFSDIANLDVIYMPRFDADRFIDGSRISFFSPQVNGLTGSNAIVQTNKPDNYFSDDELSLRLYKNFGVIEAALYVYDGFWKSPGGFDPVSGKAIFPDLQVYGASIRLPAGKGIASLEIGYYDSSDDQNGTDPFINNSEFRFLAGYELEIGKNLTMGLQYYLERMSDYDEYLSTLPTRFSARDHNRHLLTLRLTKLTHNQNMTWSLFAYASPSDQDFYLRPHVHYKVDDSWSVEAGGNIFGGSDNHTFFGQFRDNTNLYGAVRFSF